MIRPVILLALAALPSAALADEPAVDIRPIDFGELTLGLGGLGRFDAPAGSSELLAGVTLAAYDLPGWRFDAGRVGVLGRPSLGTSEVYGDGVKIDWMFFGHSSQSEGVCVAAPNLLCDEDTGIVGFGAEAGTFHIVPQRDRREVRVVGADVVLSPTHAFDPDWPKHRVIGRVGATLDSIAPHGFDSHTWVGRLSVGVDGGVAAGPVDFEASVRWRPNFLAFADDFGFEARIDVLSRLAWDAFLGRANVRVGGAIVYSRWSDPTWAFGADRVDGAVDSLTVRLVLSPSIYSVLR